MSNNFKKTLVNNKRAKFDYTIEKEAIAGLVLTGAEVKSLRLKQASLSGAYVQILADGTPILLGAQITPYKFADNRDYDPKRTRRLLLRKKEIENLRAEVKNKGYTLVPVEIFVEGAFIKLRVGLGRGKKQFEKRETIKKRDLDRERRRGELI